ncbi:MAG: hypothetical protein AAGA30_15035, partial [Planctomycetota bacterium]
ENLGYCGGLLIVNGVGRPLEFHSSAPIIPNEAQRILYGATLEEFIACDQIAVSLLGKCKKKPTVLLIDDERLNSVALIAECDVVFVLNEESGLSENNGGELTVNNQNVRVVKGSHENLANSLREFTEILPLQEPLSRIYQAINAAHSEAA